MSLPTESALPEVQIDRKTPYQGCIVQAHHDTVRLANGEQRQRDVVTHPGGVCVLPLLDEQTALLIEQFRYATGEFLLEAPAGKLDVDGETPFEAVQRELWEETGYQATQWQEQGFIYTAPGFCDERIYLYTARGLYLAETHRPIDEEEAITLKPYTKTALQALLKTHQLKDAKTLALLAYWFSL
ncbi:MAG: NUDIX hydrolase [Vampirovibrionales bacterium]